MKVIWTVTPRRAIKVKLKSLIRIRGLRKSLKKNLKRTQVQTKKMIPAIQVFMKSKVKMNWYS